MELQTNLKIVEKQFEIPLFEWSEGFCVPLTNGVLCSAIAKCFLVELKDVDGKEKSYKNLKEEAIHTHKDATTALKQTRVYYRALGRLMIHSVVTGHVLPHYLIPPFYRACKCL